MIKNNDRNIDMICGCGRNGVYDMGDGIYACNKYRRCPTYSELEQELRECRMELHEANVKLNAIADAKNIINELYYD